MIGNWDDSNCVLALAFAAHGNGNGRTSFNTGTFPSFPNGAFQPCTLTNMGAGFGYVYVPGGGGTSHCNFDGINDYIQTQWPLVLTAANSLTFEIKATLDVGCSAALCGAVDDDQNRFWIIQDASDSGRIDFFFEMGDVIDRARTNDNAHGVGNYTVHCVKNAAANLRVWVDAVEAGGVGYQTQNAYGLGANTLTNLLAVGDRGAADLPFGNVIYWFAIYSADIGTTRIAANHALPLDMGLFGYSTGGGGTMDLRATAISNPPNQSTVSSQVGIRIG